MKPRHSRPGFALCMAGIVVLAGCGTGEPQDVRVWMEENAKGLRGKVPDLPEIKPLPVIAYEPGELAAPFSVDKLLAAAASGPAKGGGPKPVNPDAYPLTRVPLESLRLIGTLNVGGKTVAIVAAERDSPLKINVGDYLGQNNGRVVAIHPASGANDGEVVVKEQVLDKGVWVERENRVTLAGQGEKK